MNDNQKTMKQQFEALRAEVDAGLNRIEKMGGSIDDAAAQLVKIGVVLSLANSGPVVTLQGLTSQFEQLRTIYPDEASAADALQKFPSVEGSA